MKIFLYFVLIIAFLIFYQSEPVYAGIIFFVIIIAILYFKFRKNRGMGSSGGFFAKGLNQISASNDNLIFLFMMQQFLKKDSTTNNNDNGNLDLNKIDKEEYIEEIKEKVLSLLDN